MYCSRLSLVSFFVLVGMLVFPGSIFSDDSADFNTEILNHIKWREIGPAAFGGRIDDIEALVDNPNIIFVATAHGGIFKTINNGTTWKAVFDEEGTALSIGDIAIAPSDSNIVWAGTGEPNNRNSNSWGDGVYKSIDGGETWKYMGLKETHHIGRIVIHPRNPEIVYVAALGHLWGPNSERGLYRTKDGGKTWDKIIYINDDTGFVDVAIEENGRVLYAAAYQRRRRAWGFVGGGPYGGLYRSMDGGDNWEKLSNGLPAGDTGRIGVEISKSDPNIVYAIIENKKGGVFRSENRGQSWTRVNELNPRPMYYSQIRIDPQNPDKIWVLGTLLFVSIDGGKTFTSEATGEKVHTDHHALWINPKNSDHLLLGNDGGFYLSYDGSKTWAFIDNLPLSQFYAIGIDNQNPYWIYGGTQDSGTYGIPSRTFCRQGILNSDVTSVVLGDGFYVVVDPDDPNAIFTETYEGKLLFININTAEEKVIRPVPEDPEKEKYRFNWNCPIVMSPHDSNIIYYGGNKVFKTSDRGHIWEEISPDLTNNVDWKKIPIMGVERSDDILSRDDTLGYYGTIATISESPILPGIIYVGTDDGNVHITSDGGKIWQNLTESFRLPGPRPVSRILASQHNKGTAYITFDGHWDDDFSPYIFKTADMGKTWKSISGNLPDGMVVNVIVEHPRNPNLLFVGTEFGLFISIDGGKNWRLGGKNLPRVPVDDIVVHPRNNDLILGTHGRGIIILDDITMLEMLDDTILNSEVYLFPPREAVQFYETRGLPGPGGAKFSGPNPEYGALITYYLKSGPPIAKDKSERETIVKIIIQDKTGEVVRELSGPDRKGFNRINWDLHYKVSFDPSGLGGGYFGAHKGPFVLPGEYTIKLMARNQESIQKVIVTIDPRIKTTPKALKDRLEASMTVSEIQRAFIEGRKATHKMRKELKHLKETLKDRGDIPEKIKQKFQDVSLKIKEMEDAFKGGWHINAYVGIEHLITGLAGQIQASTFPPTQADSRSMQYLMNKVNTYIEKVNTLITREFPELQKYIEENRGSLGLVTKPIKPAKHH